MSELKEEFPYVPAAGFEDRRLDELPPPHTGEQIGAMGEAPGGLSAQQTGMINHVIAEPRKIFVPQWKQAGVANSGWYNAIYVQTTFHKAGGRNTWIRQWVHQIDGVFVMPYRETQTSANPMLKWTDRSRNDFDSLPLGMSSVLHHGIWFIPQDGNLNREIYFWTQVFDGDTWLRHEDRPVRWPK